MTTPDGQPDFLGFGIVTPFQRDQKNDFANAGGMALLRSCLSQILGVKCDGAKTAGEIPWRTEFGSLLHQLRQKNNTPLLVEMARAYVQDAIARWEPRLQVVRVSVEPDPFHKNRTVLLVKFRPISHSQAGSGVILPDAEVTVPFAS